MSEDNPVYYPIRKSPRRLVLTCQRCHGETNWLLSSPRDRAYICPDCLVSEAVAFSAELHRRTDERLYPVPDDGDGEYDDPRRNITTVPHV